MDSKVAKGFINTENDKKVNIRTKIKENKSLAIRWGKFNLLFFV